MTKAKMNDDEKKSNVKIKKTKMSKAKMNDDNKKSKSKMSEGFRQFLIRTGLFLVGFVVIQMILILLKDLTLPKEFYFILDVDIGKALIFAAITFFFLGRDKLNEIRKSKFKLKDLIIFGILSILSFAGYFYLKDFLVSNPVFAVENLWIFYPLKELTLLLGTIFLAIAIYGIDFSRFFYNKFKREIGISAIIFIVALFLIVQFQKLWVYLSYIVANTAYFLLNLGFNAKLTFSGVYPNIGINTFIVNVGKPCSGIDSIIMFVMLYLFIIFYDWEMFNKTKVLVMFIPGVISVFILNIIRIYLLILIGAFVSRDFAIGIFHTSASMILFLIYFLIFWFLFYEWMKKPKFRKKKGQRGFVGKKVERVMSDSLYRNSIYLMLNTLIMSFFGFIFWMIASRLYSAENIGLATAIISVMGLITGLSVLGLNVGLIRYLPKSKDKNKKINTAITLVTLSTVVVTCIFIMFSGTIAPKLTFIHDNVFMAFVFILFMVVASANSLIDSIFVAFRNTKQILVKNTIFSVLKIVGLFFLVWLGAFGIFSSWMISLLIGVLITLVILVREYGYRPRFTLHDSIIKQMGSYSFGNYVAGFIGGLPLMILPILILNKLGSETVAYYYMAMMIATLLFIIPQATSQSLFAEGSYSDKDLKKQIRKAVKIIGFILIPAILIIVFFGQYILMMFGKEYANEGFRFLQLLAVSGVFVGGYKIFEGVLKVKGNIKGLLGVAIFNAAIIIGLSSFFMGSFGLMGIAFAWMIGYMVSLIVFRVVVLMK